MARRGVAASLHVLSWTLVALPLALLITTATGDAVQPYRTVGLGVQLAAWVVISALLAVDHVRVPRVPRQSGSAG